MDIKNITNQVKFYLKKYGLFKTIKKCFVVVKNKEYIKHEYPYGSYIDWFKPNELFDKQVAEQRKHKFKNNPKISIVVPMYNTPKNFFEELVDSCIRQSYTNWELCLADGSPEENKELRKIYSKDKRIKYKFLGKNEGISGNTNEALKMVTGDYIALLDHDDLLSDYALYFVVECINNHPDVEFMYSDEDKINEKGDRYDAYFKPDFAPDTLRCQNYICHFSIFKKELMDKLEGFRSKYDGAQDYDIFLRMSEITEPSKIRHIPRILYHWRVHSESTAKLDSNAKNYAFDNGVVAIQDHINRLGLKGKVTPGEVGGTYRTDYEVIGNPKVSIIIPNKDGKDILEVCIKSLLEKTTYTNYEIVIVENNSTSKEIFKYYTELEKNEKIKVVKYPETGFNYPAIINYGVRNSDGEYVVQLNNDTELITPNWLELMLGFCQRKDVGGVGVKLYYPDNTIQHAGIIVGLGGVAGHRFKEVPKGGHGYFAKESMIEDLSAVTAACIMNPRSVYEEVGYMDEGFAVAFNDVDFCLKIREKGYLIVYNPFVEFKHYESKSRGTENTPEKIKRFQGEIARFKERWQDFLDEGDPYYNINLSLDTEQYHIKAIEVDYSKNN
ncbi:MAG: glycosyltransferase family 2 protein [Clostridia bacterium]|nr:glycosyltransferase family 2 protein [Clostridia bacterium]